MAIFYDEPRLCNEMIPLLLLFRVFFYEKLLNQRIPLSDDFWGFLMNLFANSSSSRGFTRQDFLKDYFILFRAS